MYVIQGLIGRKFYVMDKNIVYTCRGYGQATPDSSRLLIVGENVDPKRNNESTVHTFRDNEVHFLPDATPASATT